MNAIADMPATAGANMTTESHAAPEAFVVLNSALGMWRKGDVVTSQELGGLEEVNRHLALRSVRAAYPAESRLKHVDLPEESRSASHEQRLAEKDEQILSLRATVREQQDAISRGGNVGVAVAAERENNSALIRQKDQFIMDVQTKYKHLETKHLALDRHFRDVSQENLQLKEKLAVMESARPAPDAHGDPETTAVADELRRKIAAAQAAAADTPPADGRKKPAK